MSWGRKGKLVLRRKQIEKIFSEHIHNWVPTADPAAQICNCGRWLISAKERDRRRDEWSAYFEFIRTTPAYLDWVEIKEAFKGKNKSKVVETLERVKLRCKRISFNEDEDNWKFSYDYQPTPNFPDPDNFPYIISS